MLYFILLSYESKWSRRNIAVSFCSAFENIHTVILQSPHPAVWSSTNSLRSFLAYTQHLPNVEVNWSWRAINYRTCKHSSIFVVFNSITSAPIRCGLCAFSSNIAKDNYILLQFLVLKPVVKRVFVFCGAHMLCGSHCESIFGKNVKNIVPVLTLYCEKPAWFTIINMSKRYNGTELEPVFTLPGPPWISKCVITLWSLDPGKPFHVTEVFI